MTRDEILNMPAGREMDIKIHVEIMGWMELDNSLRLSKSRIFNKPEVGTMYDYNVPNYSTDIAAAWQVVDEMWEKGFFHELAKARGGEIARIGNKEKDTGDVFAETAPLAICRAALLAMMEADNG
jgi:hypothetical protein